VGCKAQASIDNISPDLCFTLTMWDVKLYTRDIPWYPLIGFTLTMWDVKENVARIKFFNLVCFTLTMWDVKGKVKVA